MSDSRGPAPGFRRNPDHRVAIRPAGERWRVHRGGELLADSAAALIVEESGHEPVVYFPRVDVRLEQLAGSDSRTTCPFKGEAAYWRFASCGDGRDVAWSYPETYDEVTDIAGFVAFYAARVTIAATV